MAAAAEVIVVGAQRDPGLGQGDPGGGRQVPRHVEALLLLAHDRGLHRDGHSGQGEAGGVRIARVEGLLDVVERPVLHAGEERPGGIARDAGSDDARAGQRGVEAHRDGLAGVRRSRPGDHEQRPGAALPGLHRLVAQVGVARQDGPRLLIGVLGEVAQDDDDLVLHVERGVAVVAEVLRFRHHEPVAGEHRRAADLGVVGEGERLHLPRRVEAGDRAGIAVGRRADFEGRPAVLHAGREAEGQAEVLLAGERLRAHRLQLGDEVIGGEPRAVGAGLTSAQALRGEHLDVGAGLGRRRRGGLGATRRRGEGQRGEREYGRT